MADPQLPLEPTIRIDPSTLVEHMPGTDAICLCGEGTLHIDNTTGTVSSDCLWPFCGWKDHINDEEDARATDTR